MTRVYDRVLVVAAHSDDETLGCGATLRRHADEGAEIAAIHFTDGVASRAETGAAEASGRFEAARLAAKILGFHWLAGGRFPDNRLDSCDLLDLVREVERAKRDIRPDLVYVHHGGDLNIDHRLAFQAALTAFRPEPGERCAEIRAFEVPSATDWSHPSIGAAFRPLIFVDVGNVWEAKLAALEAYKGEIRPFPHARSVEAIVALAMMRGGQAGLAKAEAFDLIRRVER